VANALDGIGELKQALGDWSGAEAMFREALAIRRTLFPPDHADIGVSYENIGIALHGQERNAEAAAMLDSALAVLEPAFGGEHATVRLALAYRDSVEN
jgi:tetratricopeptide (TPR) repeat protein